MFRRIIDYFRKNKYNDYDDDEYGYDDLIVSRFSHGDDEAEIDEMSLPVRKKIDYDDKEERLCLIRDCCEQIITARNNLEEAKEEYAVVTNYLSDMQRYSSINEGVRKDVMSCARNVDRITKDREKRMNGRKNSISEKQMSMIEPYEDIMPEEIKKLEEYEEYQLVIDDDMRKLEGERGAIKYEKKSILNMQEFLKFLMTVTLTFIVIGTCFCVCVYKINRSDMTIPFFVMLFVAAAVAFYAAVKGIDNRKKLKQNAAKMNRLIELVNKTKIKYANNKSVVDYMRAKYGVKNCMELKYVWGQYMIQVEADRTYKRNAVLYDSYSRDLVNILTKVGFSDPEIWVHQTDALIDKKRMKEIRVRLEDRRKKLIKRIEFNNKLFENAYGEIKKVIRRNSGYKIEVVAILKRYGIEL